MNQWEGGGAPSADLQPCLGALCCPFLDHFQVFYKLLSLPVSFGFPQEVEDFIVRTEKLVIFVFIFSQQTSLEKTRKLIGGNILILSN